MPQVKNYFQNPLLKTRLQPLFCMLITLGLLLLLYFFGPQQLPVVAYKLVMPILGGFIGGWAWLAIMPYANPSRYLARDWRADPESDREGKPDFPIAPGCEPPFCIAVFCMTLAIVAGMLSVAWGL